MLDTARSQCHKYLKFSGLFTSNHLEACLAAPPLQSLVNSLEKRIDETEKRFEETNKLSEERLKQATEAESKIVQLKTAMQRLLNSINFLYLRTY